MPVSYYCLWLLSYSKKDRMVLKAKHVYSLALQENFTSP